MLYFGCETRTDVAGHGLEDHSALPHASWLEISRSPQKGRQDVMVLKGLCSAQLVFHCMLTGWSTRPGARQSRCHLSKNWNTKLHLWVGVVIHAGIWQMRATMKMPYPSFLKSPLLRSPSSFHKDSFSSCWGITFGRVPLVVSEEQKWHGMGS